MSKCIFLLSHGLAVACFAGLALNAQSPAIKVVLATDEEVPGLEGVSWKVPLSSGNPSNSGISTHINAQGDLVGEIGLQGSGVTTDNDSAVYYLPAGGQPQLLLREGDPAVGVVDGGVFSQFNQVRIDDEGIVYIHGNVGIPGEFGFFTFLISGRSGELAVAAREGMGYDEDRNLISISGYVVHRDGGLVTIGVTELKEPNNLGSHERLKHIWRGLPSPANEIVRTLKDYEFLPQDRWFVDDSFDDSFVDVRVNESGNILFEADIKNTAGVWFVEGSSISTVALDETPAPGGGTYDRLDGTASTLTLGDGKTFAFSGTLKGEGITSENDRALFLSTGGEISRIWTEGQPAPGTVNDTLGFPVVRQFGSSGNYLLQASITGGTAYWEVPIGSFQADAIALPGTVPPFFPDGSFSQISNGFIGRTGKIAFDARPQSGSKKGVWTQGFDGEIQYAAGRDVEVLLPDERVVETDGAVLLNGQTSDDDGRFPVVLSYRNGWRYIALVDPNFLGMPPIGISGRVFEDADYDGEFSLQDKELADVKVELFADDGAGNPTGPALQSTESLNNGSYEFLEIESGSYVVVLTAPDNFDPQSDTSPPIDDGRIPVDYEAGTIDNNHDFLLSKDLIFNVGLSLHKVTATAVTNLDAGLEDSDAPLEVSTNLEVLANLPAVSTGLVADGVTPLLIKVIGPELALPLVRNLQAEIAQVEGGSIDIGLSNRLRVLQDGSWSGESFQFELPDVEEAVNWLQIAPIQSEQVDFSAGSTELTVSLRIWDADSELEVGEIEFSIRKPPMVLVHGANSDGDWGDGFLLALEQFRPGFIIPVSYGKKPVFRISESLNKKRGANLGNSIHSLTYLARLLQRRLDTHAEIQVLHEQWAMTRYDVLGHGQGGVLLRMLSSEDPSGSNGSNAVPAVRPFQCEANFNRGTFHRIVTVGSPHNGSRLIYYVNKLFAEKIPLLLDAVLPYIYTYTYGTSLQSAWKKWDPLQTEIQRLNDSAEDATWKPDPQAKFHLVSTALWGGEPPGERSTMLTAATYLNEDSGPLLLESGFDGLVDVESQEGRLPGAAKASNVSAPLPDENLSHNAAGLYYSDRVLGEPATAQTESDKLARYVAGLFDLFERGAGAEDDYFKAFPPLTRYQPEDFAAINALVDSIDLSLTGNLSTPAVSPKGLPGGYPGRERAVMDAPGNYALAFTPDETHPLSEDQTVDWRAWIYGENGQEPLGDALVVDSGDSTQATLTVFEGRPGQYWVQAFYQAEDNTFVGAEALLVASFYPDGASPEQLLLVPDRVSLVGGESFLPELTLQFSDGSVLQQSLASATVLSSDSGVVDVSNPSGWSAVSEGRSAITVELDGLKTVVHWTVENSAQRDSVGYDIWREAFFEETDLGDPAISGPDADPDGDQATNLIEYVRASDPWRSDDSNTIEVESVRDGNQSYARVSFPLREVLENIQVTLQRSNELGQWEDLLVATDPGALDSPLIVDASYSPAVSVFTLRDEVPLPEGPEERFYRLTAGLINP